MDTGLGEVVQPLQYRKDRPEHFQRGFLVGLHLLADKQLGGVVGQGVDKVQLLGNIPKDLTPGLQQAGQQLGVHILLGEHVVDVADFLD